MLKRIRWLIAAGVNAALTVLLVTAAKLFPLMFPLFYTELSRKANRFLSGVTAVVPVPVWELALLALVLWQIISLIRCIAEKKILDWLARLPLILTTLALLFVAIWGLNHFAPDISESVDLHVGEYTESQLQQALTYYADRASEYSVLVERDADGAVVLPEDSALSDAAVESYRVLAQTWPRFSDPAPRVKMLLGSELFGYLGTTGIYVCLTGEASVSRAAFAANIPFDMCHELGHSLCFAGEDEANFAGFLACSVSEDPLFRYSGYLSAFIYCYNALYETSPAAAQAVWNRCSDEMLADCRAQRAHYEQYDGAVQDAAQSVNNAYLESFDQEGVRSYDMVTEHLIAYYLQYLAYAR